jgi:hypothetical protein
LDDLNSDLVIKDYEDEIWPDVHRLFRGVFGKDLDKRYFKWKNKDNPNGNSIAKVTFCRELIIGYSCIIKYRMCFLGKNIMAGQSVDAMVDEKFRRKGAYENMAVEALKDAKKQGLGLRFNFPNHDAYMASVNKVNIKKVCDVPQFLKILDGPKSFGIFTGNKLLKMLGGSLLKIRGCIQSFGLKMKKNLQTYEIIEIRSFDKRFDELWQKVSSGFSIAVVRDSDYLNWRYAQSISDYKIIAAFMDKELVGYIVGTIEDKVGKDGEILTLGHIADIVCHSEHSEAAVKLITAMEECLKSKNACAVSCWMLKHWFYAKILKNQGFLQLRSPAMLAALPIDDTVKNEEDTIYNQQNWFITIGDSDYI